MPKLENQVAIVTGASAGIGLSAARFLANEGAQLVLTARREDRLKSLAEKTGGTIVAGDITDAAVREEILEACNGRVDLLINNAGYGEPGPVETLVEPDWRRQFEVNFFAAAALMQGVAPIMRAQGSGRIVNISSVAGRFGYPLFGWYCATKHALEGLSDAARLELGAWGIHVVLVEPGPIKTEFFDVTMELATPHIEDEQSPYAPFFAQSGEIEKEMDKHSGTADDVARVILKACTAARPRARYAVTAMAKLSIFMAKLMPRSLFDWGIRRQFRVPKSLR